MKEMDQASSKKRLDSYLADVSRYSGQVDLAALQLIQTVALVEISDFLRRISNELYDLPRNI